MVRTPNLLPPDVRGQIPLLYSQEHSPDPIVYAKLFTPNAGWTWYVTEFDPQEELCFGYVVGLEEEWGYFSLRELQEIRVPLTIVVIDVSENERSLQRISVSIERDVTFEPQPFSQVITRRRKEQG